MPYILAIDSGTTSVRAIIYDENYTTIATAQREITQYYPALNFVEHDPIEIYNLQYAVCVEAIKKADIAAVEIKSIGITNQRETTVVWDKSTGKPIYNAIVWQDKRTVSYCDLFKKTEHRKFIESTTGLQIDSYFSAFKICWILDNIAGAREQAERGNLLFGTIDTWLLWKLSKGEVHATDASNASRTLLFDLASNDWCEPLLSLFNIPKSMLPTICNTHHHYATVQIDNVHIPVMAMVGDQQAALCGHQCYNSGEAKNTYGTGCFLLMNIGTEIKRSSHLLITTVAWRLDNVTAYALEGSVFNAGSALQWLRDDLQMIATYNDVETCCMAVEDTAGVIVVPAFAGLGAPHWNEQARGSITGLSRNAKRNHIVRATVESIAYQSYDVLMAMQKDAGVALKRLKVDGGVSASDFLMQFQADILQCTIERPSNRECTSLGVAMLANYKGVLRVDNKIESIEFVPKLNADLRNEMIQKWRNVIDQLV